MEQEVREADDALKSYGLTILKLAITYLYFKSGFDDALD